MQKSPLVKNAIVYGEGGKAEEIFSVFVLKLFSLFFT